MAKSYKKTLKQISIPQEYHTLVSLSKQKQWSQALKTLEGIAEDVKELGKSNSLPSALAQQFLIPEEYLDGTDLYKERKWSQALEKFEQSIKKQPKHADSYFKAGVCHMKLDHLEQAHHYISHAIKLAPKKEQWQAQLQQCEQKLQNANQTTPVAPMSTARPQIDLKSLPPRIQDRQYETAEGFVIKKKLLLVPSDYNHRAMADILPFVPFYSQNFDVYIIVRELAADIISESTYTLVKNGTSYGEFLKFTADYVIDAGSLNYGYRITDTTTWTSVWHGIPYKKMFVDLDIKHLATAIRYNLAYDSMISMSDYYTDTFLRGAMRYSGTIHQVGSAKTDKLFTKTNQEVESKIRHNLGITTNKVVVYAPSYRTHSTLKLNFSAQDLLNKLGSDYSLVVLLDKKNELDRTDWIDNPRFVVTHDLSDLDTLLLADILISDYHTIIHLFQKYNKPVVLYQYDYETFLAKNLARRDEIELLTSTNTSVTRAYHFNRIDWSQLAKMANQTRALPENIFEKTLRFKLNIPEGKKVILYAPTFRKAGAMNLPFDPEKLISSTKNQYVIITKLHYLNKLGTNYEGVIDCTEYGEITDLMRIADVLISDYSSLILDFALLNKPIILFQYDYFDYVNQRGVYFEFEDYLPADHIIDRENDLYKINWKQLKADNQALIKKFYPLENGYSTERIVSTLGFDSTPRKMKEIIFLVNDLHQIGGVHTFAHNMAKYFKTHYNTKIHLLAIKEFAQANTELHFFDSPYFDVKISSQYLNGACSNILQNTDGYVISLQFSAHMHFQRHLYKAKSILMFHGDVKDMISGELYGPHLGWLNNEELYNYDKFLLLTKTNKDLIDEYLNSTVASKTGFMHNSVDHAFTNLPTSPNASNHLAVISRLDADKNIFALIELAKHLKDLQKDIVINIYGDGELKEEFQSQVVENQLENHLILKGFEMDKKRIFSENSALLLPSKSEGMPLVVLEAYSYNRPVIAFDSFTAAREVIIHGKTGFLASYGNFEQMIDNIEKLPTLQAGNIELHYKNFENDTIFARWTQLFEELDHLHNSTK